MEKGNGERQTNNGLFHEIYLVAAVQQSHSQQEKKESINKAQCWALTSSCYKAVMSSKRAIMVVELSGKKCKT